MTTTFNINRLGLLLKRYFIENKNKEIMYWGILILVFTLLHSPANAKMILYIMGFIFAAKQFKTFAFTPGGMHYLLIPATHLEKLISAILLTTIYYFTMFTITYSIGNIAGTTLYNFVFSQSNKITWDFFSATGSNSILSSLGLLPWGNAFLGIVINFLIIQSIFLLGSIYFKRAAIVKTLLSIFAFYFIFGMIELFFTKIIFADLTMFRGMSSMTFMTNNSTFLTNLGYSIKIVSYLLIPYFWLVTYFRLTEKQV